MLTLSPVGLARRPGARLFQTPLTQRQKHIQRLQITLGGEQGQPRHMLTHNLHLLRRFFRSPARLPDEGAHGVQAHDKHGHLVAHHRQCLLDERLGFVETVPLVEQLHQTKRRHAPIERAFFLVEQKAKLLGGKAQMSLHQVQRRPHEANGRPFGAL